MLFDNIQLQAKLFNCCSAIYIICMIFCIL